MSTTKKTMTVPLAQSPEYMRRYRLKHNPDPRSRVAVKVKSYCTEAQAKKIEKIVDAMIRWEN